MGTVNKLSISMAVVAMVICQSIWAGDLERRQAHRINNRLTGAVAPNSTINDMEALLISDSSGKTAAEYAIDTAQNPAAPSFYNVTLKNFVTPWTNEEQTVFTPLNDYTATAIGLIRDGADFRRILYDDVIYRGNNGVVPGLNTQYSDSDNNHYEQLEALGPVVGDLSDSSVLIADTQSSVTAVGQANGSAATAGVITSRAGAMAFFSDGTNRAMFRFTLMNHLCTDLEPLKDVSRTPDRVRRDVSRSPGGDSRIFLNGCVGCHAGMDGMAGAFAFYEWNYTNDKSDGSLGYTPGAVSAKHNINPSNFEYGYITTGDRWVNYWRNGPNSILGNRPGDTGIGWGHPAETLDSKGNAVGNGAKSLGMELANSKNFAQCQVDKAFKAICLRDPNLFSADRNARDGFVSNFTGSNYDMREVFTDVAAFCKGS